MFIFNFFITMPVWHQLCFSLHPKDSFGQYDWITAYLDGDLAADHVDLGVSNMPLDGMIDQIWTNMEIFR
jgi:hypothetical protein